VLSIHCPLTPATRHLLSARELSVMKASAILVNTARGPIVDEAALAAKVSYLVQYLVALRCTPTSIVRRTSSSHGAPIQVDACIALQACLSVLTVSGTTRVRHCVDMNLWPHNASLL
jgi:hypothetical protein